MLISASLLMMGCAASYIPITPNTLNYNINDFQDGISFSYKHNVLRERGNRKYARKEIIKNVKLVAVQITNNTDTAFTIGKDALFYSGNSPLTLMEPMEIKKEIQQIVPAYLSYLALSFVSLQISETKHNEQTTNSYPVGLVLGPGLALGNMAVAGNSNKKMLNELYTCYINTITLKKGETVHGIIGIRSSDYLPISLKLKNSNH